MPDTDNKCPVNDCDECEHHRVESWCALAVPRKEAPSKEYKIYMEGFWEGLRAAEKEYESLIEVLEEYDAKYREQEDDE